MLAGEFKLTDRDLARRYFLELRQNFIDWNYHKMDSKEFKELEAAIDAKMKEQIKNA